MLCRKIRSNKTKFTAQTEAISMEQFEKVELSEKSNEDVINVNVFI